MASAFTPATERARHDARVTAIGQSPLGRPAWVLCGRESVARMLLDAAARSGGAFVRVVDWSQLTDVIESALGLPFVARATDADRVRSVERCLALEPAFAASMRSDPVGVALGLLSVADTLRHHGGLVTHVSIGAVTAADTLVASHLRTLASVVAAVEDDLRARATADLVTRLRRIRDASAVVRSLPFAALAVEGFDRLTPLEREVLESLMARGVAVDVAPWVEGWPGSAPATPAPTPATLLDAMATDTHIAEDDRSVVCVAVNDPHEEAETVARWIAEAVARGMPLTEVAVAVSSAPGAARRVARALARYGLPSYGGSASPVQVWPLWQVVRASVRLGWRGVDVVDITTVLSAPGSGVWGSDRDWLCAQIRRTVPTGYKSVREVLTRAMADPTVTDTAKAIRDDEDAVTVVELDADPERIERLKEIRARVGELLDLWETHGPMGRWKTHERPAALRAVVEATLARFVNPMRFREGVGDDRIALAWVSGAAAIDAACRAALDRVDTAGVPLPAHDPGAFLSMVEPLLGSVADAVAPRRGEGVALLADDPHPSHRPGVLLVTGFHRGRFPASVGRSLLLGPLEREQLAAMGGGLAELPDDAARGAMNLRESARILAVPSQRLVLLWPRRTAEGEAVEPSLAYRDLLARLGPDARAAREREGFVPAARWLATDHPGAARTSRAQVLDGLAALGDGRVEEAVALVAPHAAQSTEVRDLAMARFRPDRRYDVGDLVRDQVVTGVFTPRALETLLTCRYSFLTGHLLGLKPLRLARAPSLTAGDRAKVARAALRALDAIASEGSAPTPDQVAGALEGAVIAHVPWADRHDMAFALEELRRTVRRFLDRYMDIRQTWHLDPPAANVVDEAVADHDEEPRPVGFELPGGHSIRLIVPTARVETHGANAMVVDLRLGSTDAFPTLRDAGLDLDAALVPAITAARRGGEVAAFVRLSLSKPRGEVLSTTDVGEPYTSRVATTVVTVDHAHPLADHRDAILQTLGATFDELIVEGDPGIFGAVYAPHDEARQRELEQAGAHTCDYCGMRLGCRFKMAGGG